MILKVAHMGHPILRQVAEKLSPKEIKSEEIQTLIRDMIDTMREYNGVGLAAPQVHVSKQIAVMEIADDNPRYPDQNSVPVTVFINPVITPLTEDTLEVWEGCLSVPGMRGAVQRPSKIRLQGLNEKGEEIDRVFEGFPAIAVQHETDHLFGILYVDKLVDIKRFAFTPEYQRYHLEGEKDVEV